MEDIQQFSQQVKDKLGLEEFDVVIDNHDNIELSSIRVPRDARKAGTGAAAMKALTDYADRTGRLIWLGVADRDSSTGTTSRARLIKFYRQFGFIPNKGRNKRFDLSMYAHMYRDPESINESMKKVSADYIKSYINKIDPKSDPVDDYLVDQYSEFGFVNYLPIKKISMSPNISYDEDTAYEYSNMDDQPPPIVLTHDYKVIDGFHRLAAAEMNKDETISAFIGISNGINEEIKDIRKRAGFNIIESRTHQQYIDEYDEEINIIRRRAGLPMINESVENAKLESGRSINLIVNPSKQDLDVLMQYVIKKLDGRKPPDGSHVKGFYNPTMKTVWIWDGTAATHGEVGTYLVNKYGDPEVSDWQQASGSPEDEFELEDEGGWVPMIIDRGTERGYDWWVPHENVYNEPAIKRLEPVSYQPRIL